jgi:uncharacterized protein YwqG
MDDTIGTMLRNTGLSRVAAQLEQLALPSIHMVSVRAQENSLPLGVSRLGGLPDLPPDTAWPTWKNIPLAFIVQINLAEVHPLESMDLLPTSGMLYFFYDADHVPVGYDPAWRGGWQVLYYDGELSRLQRVPVPTALLEKEPTWMPKGQHYATCTLMFSLEMTLPPVNSTYVDALKLSRQERHAYWNVLSMLEQRTSAPLHRLLGHPDALQGDMQTESQLVSHGLYLGNGWPEDRARVEQLLSGAYDWRLLLQLDTDPEAEMLWGIEGRCYFWIQAEALRKHHFENAWFIMQWT